MTKPETKRPTRHPEQKEHEITASEVARLMRVQRQTVWARHRRHPDKFPGRMLPYIKGQSVRGMARGRGLLVFPMSSVRVWQDERKAAREKAQKVARLRAEGLWVNGRKD